MIARKPFFTTGIADGVPRGISMIIFNKIVVRNATASDIGEMAAIEREVYGRLGTPVFTEDYFRVWLDVHPAGLFVALCDGRIVGYKYSQIVEFDFDQMHRFTNYDEATDGGYTRATHRPNGNAFKGVSLCSVMPGAGRALFRATFDAVRRLGKRFYFCFTRMSGFDNYLCALEDKGNDVGRYGETEIARWYASRCARSAGGFCWPVFGEPPRLQLPMPSPDPVLSKQLKLKHFGLAGIVPECMRDPQSRNFAAFLIYRNPDYAE